MTEKEKMMAGELYLATFDETLEKEREIAKELCYDYNHLRPSEKSKRNELLKKIIGKIGDNTVIGAGSVVTKDIPPNVVAVRKSLQSYKKSIAFLEYKYSLINIRIYCANLLFFYENKLKLT